MTFVPDSWDPGNLAKRAVAEGWEPAAQSVLSRLSNDGVVGAVSTMYANRTAWRFVVHPERWGQVLCFDSNFGNTARAFYHSVDSLTLAGFDGDRLEAARLRLELEYQSQIDTTPLAPHDRLPFPDDHFDVVLIDNLSAVLAVDSRLVMDPRTLVTEVGRVIRPGGAAFVAFRRRVSLESIVSAFRRRTEVGVGFSAHQLRRVSGNVPHVEATTYPALFDGSVPREILTAGGHLRVAGASHRDRIKAWVFGRSLGRHATNGAILTLHKAPVPQDFLRRFLPHVPDPHPLTQLPLETLSIRRYFVLSGAAILHVGTDQDDDAAMMVILPVDAAHHRRRHREAATLTALRDSGHDMAQLAPVCFGYGEALGQPYALQSVVSGVAVDRPPALTQATEHAAGVITTFHEQTRREDELTDERVEDLFLAPLGMARRNVGPTGDTAFTALQDALIARLPARLPTVWTHGDYKIENVLFAPRTHRVSAVIDWDLSQQHGLPALDLLFLFTYNRVLAEHLPIDQVVRDTILPRAFTPAEHRMMGRYQHVVGLSDEHLALLLPMLWIHHIAYRYRVHQTMTTMIDRMVAVAQAAADALSRG